MKIVVRMPNWVGDLVMATPILADLRHHFKRAEITAMAERSAGELLEKDPSIDELFLFKRPPNSLARRDFSGDIVEKIGEGRFDLGILLTNSLSSAWWFWSGKVKRRVGYRGFWRSCFLTDRVEMGPSPLHQVDRYKKLLIPLGIQRSNTAPRLFVTEEEKGKIVSSLPKGRPVIAINPGAAYGSAKCWLPDSFRALAKKLSEDHLVVFIGTEEQKALIHSIIQDLPVISLAGMTSLRELAALLSVVDLLITNDSGPMHIRAAFQKPLIALFGSTDPEKTGPFGYGSEAILYKKAACSPCFRRTCPIDFRCMKAISVEDVLSHVEQLFSRV